MCTALGLSCEAPREKKERIRLEEGKKSEILGLPPFGPPTLRRTPSGPNWPKSNTQKLTEVEIGRSRPRLPVLASWKEVGLEKKCVPLT